MKTPGLRHDEELAVRIIEDAVDHRAIGEVKMNAEARPLSRIAITGVRHEAVDEVRRR